MILITWNMQGGSAGQDDKWTGTVQGWITTEQKGVGYADVICLQECSLPPESWKLNEHDDGIHEGVVNLGTESRPKRVWIVIYEFGDQNNRCSLGIIIKRDKPTSYEIVRSTDSSKLRPLVGVQVENNQDSFVYSIHAPSANHKFSASVANGMLEKVEHSLWICAGDFNSPPDTLKNDEKWSQTWALSNSEQPTQQSGGVLDYLVTNWSANSVKYLGKPSGGISDHYAQMFQIN